MDKKATEVELKGTKNSDSVALFNKAVLEAAKMFIQERYRDYRPYWTPKLDNLRKASDQARDKMES